MASRYSLDYIDLAQLPAPSAVEPLDYATIFARNLSDFISRDPAYQILLESDPAVKVLEVGSFMEEIMRGRVNDAVKAVLLPLSYGTNLDALGARFEVERMVVDPGDPRGSPPTPVVMESDERFRRRIQLAPEAFSTCGSLDAYLFHTLTADPRVSDAAVYNHASGLVQPGQVRVVVLAADMAKIADVLDTVRARLFRRDIKPLTTDVQLTAATRRDYGIDATLFVGYGPAPAVIQRQAVLNLTAYQAECRKVGQLVAVSGIEKALHVGGVSSVRLASPAADVVPALTEYAHCASMTVRVRPNG